MQQVGSAVVNVQVVEKAQQDQGDDQGDGGGGGGSDNDDPFGDFFRRFGIPSPNAPPRSNGRFGASARVSSPARTATSSPTRTSSTTPPKITVTLTDRREFDAKVVGVDQRTDIAVIKINAQGNLPVVSIGNSDSLKPGQWVLAIGSPFGFENTVTAASSAPRRAHASAAVSCPSSRQTSQ